MTPNSLFRCLPLSCTMAVHVCLNRQSVKRKVSGALVSVYPFCVSCKQGKENRAAMPDFKAQLRVDPVIRKHVPRKRTTWAEVRRSGRAVWSDAYRATWPRCACGKPVCKPTRKYCSRDCAFREQGKERCTRRPGDLSGKLCETCGTPLKVYFNTRGHYVKGVTANRKYCSRSCGGKGNAKHGGVGAGRGAARDGSGATGNTMVADGEMEATAGIPARQGEGGSGEARAAAAVVGGEW